MRRLLLLAFACLPAGVALAQVSVLSAAPDSVSLTIYRDDLALVTETRHVDLPAGEVTLELRGVVESLLPQSAVFSGTGRALAETNYRFDRLTPASLLERSVGKVVTVVRTNPGSGTVTRMPATIESAGEGVVLRAVDGSEALQCSGLPERLEFSEVPGELTPTPTLSVRLAGGEAGVRTVTVSYLARGFTFQADYVAKLNRNSTRMDLAGWITLRNDTGSAFRQAQVQVVAGRLNLIHEGEGGSRGAPRHGGLVDEGADPATRQSRQDQLRALEEEEIGNKVALLHRCFPVGLPFAMDVVTGGASATGGASILYLTDPREREELEEVTVTGSRIMSPETLGDYQMYRLPRPTDLNARQSKQVAFLEKKGVRVGRVYRVWVANFEDEETYGDGVDVLLRLTNDRAAKLGEPLPAGVIRIFEPGRGSDVFAGESGIRDTPVGVPLELSFAHALDIESDFNLDEISEDTSDGLLRPGEPVRIEASHHFVSRKQAAATIEVRRRLQDGVYETPAVVRSSLRVRREDGYMVWRFRLRPGAERRLHYVLEARELED